LGNERTRGTLLSFQGKRKKQRKASWGMILVTEQVIFSLGFITLPILPRPQAKEGILKGLVP
jgi:hypothetical protein